MVRNCHFQPCRRVNFTRRFCYLLGSYVIATTGVCAFASLRHCVDASILNTLVETRSTPAGVLVNTYRPAGAIKIGES